MYTDPGIKDPVGLSRRIQGSASYQGHPVEAVTACGVFLGELARLGAPAFMLGMLEEAYWSLLIEPDATKWDNESPFRPSRQPAIERIGDALRELGSATDSPEIADALFRLLYKIAGGPALEKFDLEDRAKLQDLSLGTVLRCAAFIALAGGAGVYEERLAELDRLVLEAVIA